MYKKKFEELNYTLIGFIIICLSIINYIDVYNFLSKISIASKDTSLQDIIIYTIYGISCDGRSNLVDVLRFSLPYILIMIFIGIYLQDILEDNKKYIHIIRHSSYILWITKNIIKLNVFTVFFLGSYYCTLIIISLVFINNTSGFTEIFYILNPLYINSSSFGELLSYQFFLSITCSFIFVLLQTLIILFTKDSHKSFMFTSLIIFTLSFIGRFDLYNPIMLCKHSLIDSTSSIHPLITITVNVILIIILYLLIIKSLKIVVRRYGI
jgi:hypothetical protein